ncbi:hypothetical protein HBA55_19215 [Pseudomaricurvus alkylphenolicus]|uniref:hypothetical protein n=1 Tax=Pseudomaricurvus alkylphenolicus TaxID=1306991 RepID=UPI0014228199|nr:hypothetical protein [Pseudomaricurvus alkylphenolicus]NIB41744.1 hypothetical protein [Pseudomaricurvus alkylphenolicus]
MSNDTSNNRGNKQARSFHFLCNHHRQALMRDAREARRFWAEAILAGREKAQEANWQKALVTFGNAMEVATILLHRDSNRSRAETRFARTAVEFGALLRGRGFQCDANILLQLVNCELDGVTLTQPKDGLINPLVEALTTDPDFRINKRYAAPNQIRNIH